MIPSPGEMSYRLLQNRKDFARIYHIMSEQRLLWATFPDLDGKDWSEDFFCKKMAQPAMYVLAGFIDNNPAGVLLLWPVAQRTLCAEIGVSAFRPYFAQARALFLGALCHVLHDLKPAPMSFIGRIAAPNRHILNMFSEVGFQRLGNIPGMIWYARKKRFVAGALVVATPETINNAIKHEVK